MASGNFTTGGVLPCREVALARGIVLFVRDAGEARAIANSPGGGVHFNHAPTGAAYRETTNGHFGEARFLRAEGLGGNA